MSKSKKYKSRILSAIHDSVSRMYEAGTIDKVTMRSFDASCLVNPDLSAEDIKLLREKNQLSQPVFANYLRTSESTIQKWETGAKRPSDMAMKLLSVVQKHGLAVLD
jgi:putative transcriptional regulator